MDPYVVIESRQQKLKTRVLQGAGKKPKWNQTFDIDVKYIGDDISFIVYDEDVTSSDEVRRKENHLNMSCLDILNCLPNLLCFVPRLEELSKNCLPSASMEALTSGSKFSTRVESLACST